MKKKTNDNPFVSRNRRRTAYLSLVVCLAILVTAGVAGAFHLTGIAKTYHAVLTCTAEPKHGPGYADFFVHTHNEDCYDENGNLWCTLPEIEAHEHDASCYTTTLELICTTPESEGHHHTAECYTRVRGDLTCELSTEPVYDEDGNLVAEGHVHTDACYTWSEELTCGKTEGEGAHHHDDACYQSVTKLTCKKQVVVLHTHDEDCYTEDEDGNLHLTCGMLEVTEHVHSEECFTVYEQDDDEPEETGNEVPADGATTEQTPEEGEDGFIFLFPEEEENENETGDDIVTDEVTTDEVTTDEVTTDEVNTDEVTTDEVTTDEVTTDEVTTDDVTTDTTEEKQEEEQKETAEEPIAEPETPRQIRSIGGEKRGATVLAEIPDGVLNEYAKLELADYDADIAKATILQKVNENAAEGEARDISAIYVIDIGFTAGGEAAFPNGEAPIRITLRANEIRSMTAPKLYHLYSGTAEQVEDAVFDTAAGTVTFSSYGFSPFAIVDLTGADPVSIDMPAQNFHDWTDEVDVYVEADEGAFPAGTTMLVTAVPQEEVIDALNEAAPNAMVRNVQAVDITFYDAEGNEIEPATAIRVKMSKKTETPAPAAPVESTESVVMHVDNAGSAQIVENATVDNSTAEFESDSFSKYIFADLLTEEVLDSLGNTYTISVTYGPEAKIPENSGLEVSEILETSDEYREYVARTESALGMGEGTAGYIRLFDIKIEKDGEKIQPADGTTVDVKIELKDAQADSLSVVHFADGENDGDKVESKTEESEAGTTVAFSTNGFSVYAVIDESTDENARVPVEFYNGNTKIATMYIKNGDVLLGDGVRQPNVSYLEDIVVDPGVGTIEGDELFRGWTTNAGYTVADVDSAMSIEGLREYLAENVIGHITEGDEAIKIYAMIYKYFDVTYYGMDEGISLGSDTVLRLRDETQASYQVSMPFTAESNAKFMGWKAIENTHNNIVDATDPETVYPNTTRITITGDVEFKVYAPTGHWLVFYENAKGATYNAPGFYLDGENTVQPANATAANMHRNGYTFSGWYKLKAGQELTDDDKDEDGNYIIGDKFEVFTFGSPLEAVVTNIYAKWTPNTQAPYTIIFWTENIDSINSAQADKQYDLTASYTGTGTVGQNIPYTFVNNGDEDYVRAGGNNYHYTGFSLIPGSVNQQVTITPEGDAVLNLYYNRIKYDLRFYLYRRNGNGNNDYQFAQNSAGGQNIWGIVNWWGETSLTNMPTTTYPGGIQNQSGVGGNNITGYYIVLSAYYGEDISDRWPTYDLIGNGRSGNTNYSPVSYVMMVGTRLKPNPTNQGDGTLKGVYNRMDENILGATNDADGNFLIVRFNSFNDWTYHCYYEAYDGQDLTGKTTRTLNGKTYYLDHDFSSRSSNTIPGSQNPPQYAGFAAVMQNASRPYYDQVYIDGVLNGGPQQNSVSGHDAQLNYYYDRLEYPIHYMDGVYVGGNDNTNILGSHPDQELHKSADIPYDADIPAADKNYKPDPSMAHEPGFVFEGWYADAACKVPYTFTKMPNNPIVVYAKWVQTQYRVFLHPNAENSTTNPDLNWGNENQQMNFRISYGNKVSTPTGIWTGGRKEFVAWFTDEACEKEIFDGDVFVLNDDTVTAEYDKTAASNYTDDMDQWGNGATFNKDTDRWWITKKLDIYAKWRTVLVGADGIGVVYVAQGTDATDPGTTVAGKVNGNDTYQDPLKYLDNAGAIAGQAAVPTDATNYQFLHWVLQRWDATAGESGAYVDVTDEHGELVTVFPGDSFTVLEEYARIVETVPDDPDTPDVIETRRTYTVQLRAEYTPNEIAKPTYINWFKNDQDPSQLLHEDKDLQINEATEIYTVVDGNPIPVRPGYRFLGWAREPEYDLDEQSHPIPETHHTAYLNLTEADLYLKYTGTGYQAKNEQGSWVDVTKVAADEATPYHAMYAVWAPVLFDLNIIKYESGTLTALPNAVFTLSEIVAEGSTAADPSAPYTLTTGGDGTAGVTVYRPAETYSLEETTPPSGYAAANDWQYTLTWTVTDTTRTVESTTYYVATPTITYTGTDGEESPVSGTLTKNDAGYYVFYNDPRNINIKLFKYDLTSTTNPKKGLGATFALYKAADVDARTERPIEGKNPVQTIETNSSNGLSSVYELPVDTYYLFETDAPAGYNMMEHPWVITIDLGNTPYPIVITSNGLTIQDAVVGPDDNDDNKVYTIQVPNNPGVELPETGGEGTLLFSVLGTILMLSSTLLILAKRKQEAYVPRH